MLKVLHIIPSLGKGGAERLVAEICKEFTEQHLVNVLLVVMDETNEHTRLTKNIQIKYCSSRVIPSISGKAKVDISNFRKIVDEFNPDIIHSHLFAAELLSRWEIKPDVVYITHCHDNMIQIKKISFFQKWNKRTITNLYERRILLKRYRDCNNNFIAISKDTELYFRKNLPNHLHRITLLHNAINYFKYNNPDKLRSDISKKDSIHLINIGRFVNHKNQTFLIDLVKMLKEKGFPARLTLLGDGPNKQKIEKKINEYGLTDCIKCCGYVSDVENYLCKADIYVHSATYEPFGLVLIEAMAAGLPVVCLDGKGNRDILRGENNGFMIEKADVGLFCEKIIQLINDKELYVKISENAKNFAKDYDIKMYAQRLVDFYKLTANRIK